MAASVSRSELMWIENYYLHSNVSNQSHCVTNYDNVCNIKKILQVRNMKEKCWLPVFLSSNNSSKVSTPTIYQDEEIPSQFASNVLVLFKKYSKVYRKLMRLQSE